MERIINADITGHIEECSVRKQMSAERKIMPYEFVVVYSRGYAELDEGITIDVVYLDFPKEFDKVSNYKTGEKDRSERFPMDSNEIDRESMTQLG